MVPLSLILRKVIASYKCGKKECKLNHLLFIDDFNQFSKGEKQMHTLVKAVHVLVLILGWRMEKCGFLTMKRGKVVRCEGIKFPISEAMNEVVK